MDQCAAFECVFEIYFSLKQSPPLSGQFFQHQGGQLRENIFRSETWVKGGETALTPLLRIYGGTTLPQSIHEVDQWKASGATYLRKHQPILGREHLFAT